MIRWFARNPVAANLLMVAIILAGIYSAFFWITLEVEPSWKRNVIRVSIPYRGATAKDVERAILLPIEAALEGVDGIKMLKTLHSVLLVTMLLLLIRVRTTMVSQPLLKLMHLT